MTLKSFKGNFKSWITFAPTSRPRKVLKKVLKNNFIHMKSYLSRHPESRRILLDILDKMPALKQRLEQINKEPCISPHFNTLSSEDDLSPQAKKIYHHLRKVSDLKQGET